LVEVAILQGRAASACSAGVTTTASVATSELAMIAAAVRAATGGVSDMVVSLPKVVDSSPKSALRP
jgi:hypothetical protein